MINNCRLKKQVQSLKIRTNKDVNENQQNVWKNLSFESISVMYITDTISL